MSLNLKRRHLTTSQRAKENDTDDVVTVNVTTVTFTERLLRSILDLRAPQQLYLVQQLANEDIKKARFKTLAESYTASKPLASNKKARCPTNGHREG